MGNILENLNEKQKEAVMHKEGPLLVIAGPGTGKTKVITHRISYLILHYDVKPEKILAITFTKKAAQEMSERISKQIDNTISSKVKIFNFHAFCNRKLREHATEINLDEDFRIIDKEEQDDILDRIVRNLDLKSSDYKPSRILTFVNQLKGNLQEITDNPQFYENGSAIVGGEEIRNIKEIINRYQSKLEQQNALDFGDLLTKTVELYEQNLIMKEKSHDEISHILVDEFHDVNLAQYRLLQLLTSPTDMNLMIVADKDQSIYSWRGSKPEYIDQFKEDYSPHIIPLEQHYRCTSTILEAANEVISMNPDRYRPSLRTDNSMGKKILHCCFHKNDEFEEASHIIKLIENIKDKYYIDSKNYEQPCSIAVLYRNHAFADILREQLALHSDIPFRQWIQATDPFQEQFNKVIVSYLSLMSSDTTNDIEQVINFPEMRINDLTLAQLKKIAQQEEKDLGDILDNIQSYVPNVCPILNENVNLFLEAIKSITTDIEVKNERISRIIPKLLDILENTRSTYRSEDIDIIENHSKLPNLSKAVSVLQKAIVGGERIHITVKYGIDEYCAAQIIFQTFEKYLDKTVQIQYLLPDSGVVRLPVRDLHILVGDFDELDIDITQANILLIGSTNSTFEGILHLEQTDESECKENTSIIDTIRSITALKLCQHLIGCFEDPFLEDIVVYDLETTGVNPMTADIIQIAAYQYNKDKNTECPSFEQKVKPPEGHIPEEITEITGISTEDVKNSPTINQVLPEFCEFIKDSILVGHNIAQYDNIILKRDMKERLDRVFDNFFYDTLIVSRRILPHGRRSLEALADEFNIPYNEKATHRADTDAKLNREVFDKLIEADCNRAQLKSLTRFLPLVAFGILAKHETLIFESSPTQRNNLNNIEEISNDVLAYLKPAIRSVKNIFNKNESSLLMQQVDSLFLEPTEKARIMTFIQKFKNARIPITPEDLQWKQGRANFIKSIRRFEEISNDINLSNFIKYQDRINKAVQQFEVINNDSTNLNKTSIMDQKQETLTLMTLHTAKGTEFDVVIILGMEEGNFPQVWQWSTDSVEEERRLFYVGMTRAKKHLYLSTSMFRFLKNQDDSSFYFEQELAESTNQVLSESMFIKEIPDEYIKRWTPK